MSSFNIRLTGKRTIARAIALLLVLGSASPAVEEGKSVLRVGYSIDKVELAARLTQKDVEAATEILLREMLRDRTELEPVFNAFGSSEEMVEAVVAGEIDFAEIHPLDYFELPPAKRKHFRPGVIVQFSEARLEKFVLLGRPGQTLKDAEGKSLRVYRGRDRGVGEAWLGSFFAQKDLGSPDDYFAEVKVSGKAEEVLLPTFFGKSDFCVAVESDYRVSVELNPQIEKRLVPIAISPGMPFVIAGATAALDEKLARRLNREIAPDLRLEPGGRQALALMGVKRIAPIQPGDLDALEAVARVVDPEGGAVTASLEDEGP